MLWKWPKKAHQFKKIFYIEYYALIFVSGLPEKRIILKRFFISNIAS